MRVSFTSMRDGSAADFDLIDANDVETAGRLPERVLAHLRLSALDDGAYRIDRLSHALQAATRAERAGVDEDWIAAALLHDVGDLLAPHRHGEVAAGILGPFVRAEVEWVVRQHGLFQRYYYKNRPQAERESRERLREHRWFEAALDFCERFDQCSFDPAYASEPLEHFEPLVRAVLTRPAREP